MIKKKQFFSNLLIWIFASITIFYTFLFQLDYTFMALPKMNTIWAAFNIVKIGILPINNILLILIGYIWAKPKWKESRFFHYWSYIFVTGLILMIATTVMFKIYGMGNLYDALFPILRNAQPTVTGVLLLSIFRTPICQKIEQINLKTLRLGLFGLLIMPTLFNHDIFGFNNGNSIIFVALMLLIGITIQRHPTPQATKKWIGWTLGLFGGSIGLMLLMSNISYMITKSQATTLRFSTYTSILTIYLAISIFKLFEPVFKKSSHEAVYILLFALLIKSNTLFNQQLAAFNTKLTTTNGAFKLVCTLTEAVMIVLIGILLNLLLQRILPRINNTPQKMWLWMMKRTPKQLVYDIGAILKKKRIPLLTGINFLVLASLSMLLMNTSLSIALTTRDSYNIFIYTFFSRFMIIVVNALIITAIYWLLKLIIRRYWISLIITNLFVLGFAVANMIKIGVRSEPILPSELSMVTALGSLLGMISPVVIVAFVILVILACGLIFWLEKKHPVRNEPVVKQLVKAAMAALFLSMSFFLNHQGSVVQSVSGAVGNQSMFYNQLVGAQTNGPLLQFLNNVDVTVMEKPKGYSKQAVLKIVKAYQAAAKNSNQTRQTTMKNQTVIFNLSESFSDPTRVPNLEISKDPMPYIRQLKKTTTSGLMMSSGYGGGTANMEYQTLTGFVMSNFSPTLPTPYSQLVTSLKSNPTIANQFGYASAIHPYSGVYYNRQAVYKKFGFNTFSYLGSSTPIKHQSKIDKNPYLSDQTAYLNTLDQINQKKSGQFINLVTMQNHYPYDKDAYTHVNYEVSGSAVNTPGAKKSAENYAQGLAYTDKAVKAFKEKIDKIQKPITWVWYGDHLPGIYSGDDLSQYGLELHETDYFIYTNKYGREHNQAVKQTATKYIGPNDFIAMLYQQTGAKLTPYVDLLLAVHEKVPAMSLNSFSNTSNTYNTGGQFVDEDGKLVTKLSSAQKKVLRDFTMIQYDITAGGQYSVKANFFK